MRKKRQPKIEKICLNCGKKFLVWQSRIQIGKGKFCSTRCGKLGKFNPFWKGGKRKVHGYIKIYKPDHPSADLKGYIPEHRLMMEQYLGRYLTKEEVIHHKNHIRNDNRLENLMILDNQSKHSSLHMKGNKTWLGKKHKPETIEKMEKSWTEERKLKQSQDFKGKGNPNYKERKYVIQIQNTG